jgi:hypothetical protein
LTGTSWQVTSQSNRWRIAASRCLTLGAASSLRAPLAVTARLLLPSSTPVHDIALGSSGVHYRTTSRPYLETRNRAHSEKLFWNATENRDAAMSRLPRLGSRVRIPSPAPGSVRPKAAENRGFSCIEALRQETDRACSGPRLPLGYRSVHLILLLEQPTAAALTGEPHGGRSLLIEFLRGSDSV